MQLTLPWGGEVGWCQLSPRGVNAACLLKPRVLLGERMRDAVLTRGADNVRLARFIMAEYWPLDTI